MGLLEPARGKVKRSFQPRTAGLPAPLNHAAFAQACPLDPPQHIAGAPPVVADETGVPDDGERDSHDYVNENETPHGRLCGEIVLLIDATAQGEDDEKKDAFSFLWRPCDSKRGSRPLLGKNPGRFPRNERNCRPFSASSIQRQCDPLPEQATARPVVSEAHIVQVRVIANN